MNKVSLNFFGDGWNIIIAILFMLVSAIYTISPIDCVPDVMPIVGQLDDICIDIAAVANFIAQIVKIVKKYK